MKYWFKNFVLFFVFFSLCKYKNPIRFIFSILYLFTCFLRSFAVLCVLMKIVLLLTICESQWQWHLHVFVPPIGPIGTLYIYICFSVQWVWCCVYWHIPYTITNLFTKSYTAVFCEDVRWGNTNAKCQTIKIMTTLYVFCY